MRDKFLLYTSRKPDFADLSKYYVDTEADLWDDAEPLAGNGLHVPYICIQRCVYLPT